MWGIIPAAGLGSRIQPLAFSKELLPVGSRLDDLIEKPKAVSEYLVERMIIGGASKICVVISPGKSDIMNYYTDGLGAAKFCYVVQEAPKGLCDAVFSAIHVIPTDESVLIGLPDTVWFPQDGLSKLPDESLSFLLFPVDHPELFDAVLVDSTGVVTKILVKHPDPGTFWIWGAIKMTGAIFHKLHALWLTRSKKDEFLGTLVNAYLDSGGKARALRYGISYVDVGTLHGYREAIKLLSEKRLEDGSGIHTSREFEIRLA